MLLLALSPWKRIFLCWEFSRLCFISRSVPQEGFASVSSQDNLERSSLSMAEDNTPVIVRQQTLLNLVPRVSLFSLPFPLQWKGRGETVILFYRKKKKENKIRSFSKVTGFEFRKACLFLSFVLNEAEMHWTLNLKENRQLFFTAKVRWFCLNFWIFSLTCAIPFVNFHGICFEFSSVHMISCCLISQDERLLIVLNNCRYVQNHVLPKLVESFRINEYPISDKLKKVLCMKTLSCVLKIKDC